MNLQGQRAVVIGGATGIGSGICRALVARGASVHLCDIDTEGASALAAEYPKGAITPYHGDVTSPDSLAKAEAAIRKTGAIALVFVNAGAVALKPLLKSTTDDWRWLFEINVFGTVNALKAFLPGLLAQQSRSRLVVTSSISAVYIPAISGVTLYMATKSAQLGLCNGLRTELEGTPVDLSVILPGPVHSSIIAKSEAARPGTVEVDLPSMATAAAAAGAIDPKLAGERIVQGIEKGEPYITTHPEEGDSVRALQERIIKAFRV